MVAGDAGWAEEAEAAVVRVVRGEAGDVAVDLDVEEVVACVRGFKSPDAAELFFDEIQDSFAIAARSANSSYLPLPTPHPQFRDEVVCIRSLAISALREKRDRCCITRHDTRSEVVACLGRHDPRAARLRIAKQCAADSAVPLRSIDSEDAQRFAAGDGDAGEVAVHAHLRLARDPSAETFLITDLHKLIRRIVRVREELDDAGKISSYPGADHGEGLHHAVRSFRGAYEAFARHRDSPGCRVPPV